jgi:hypothetical protein
MRHHTPDFEIRAFCDVKWLIVAVVRYEHKMPIAFIDVLHSQFAIHYGNHDAVIRWLKSPVYDEKVTRVNPRSNHRVASYLDEEGSCLVFDEVLIEVKSVF